MKILTIHADFIEFEAKKKAFAAAEEGIASGHKQRIEECLVVFTAVEKRDEAHVSGIVQRYIQEIKNIAQQVNAQNIVLYPYAHLSSQLSNPETATSVLQQAETLLKAKYKVFHAPFGWYKAFNISCKGHPLSELSREFTAEEPEKIALKREAKDEPFAFHTEALTSEQKAKYTLAALFGLAIQKFIAEAKVGSIDFNRDRVYVDLTPVKMSTDYIEKVKKEVERLINSNNNGWQFVEEKDPAKVSKYQREIINDTKCQAKSFTLKDQAGKPYNTGTVTPLYKDALTSLTNIKEWTTIDLTSTAYWKNNENNEQLSRFVLIAWDVPGKKEEYLKQLEEAENRSHLKIGKEQGLFVVSDLVGAGLPLLAPKGAIIRNEIIAYLWELHKDKGYQQVWTPHIAKENLYKTSGHWDKFGDELFKVKGKTENFVMKPMNCPHHMQIYDHFSYSYRDLPVRFFEPATIYRDEKSGQLLGLSRVRAITQDDGHLFCRISQITQEVKTIVGIVHRFYKTLGMDKDYWVSLSVRGEDQSKYLGSPQVWDTAEHALEDAARQNNLPYKKIAGEAAFYGPKLDFMFKDALGRQWQLATIQLDFNLPERFNLSYMNEDSKKERPVVIHRAISGSIERFMSVLIEHFAGKFPLWLSPVQVKILTVNNRHLPFAEEINALLSKQNFRVKVEDKAETMGKKIRDAQLEKVNYIITIGDKEVETKTLAVRDRSGNTQFNVKVEEFVNKIIVKRTERSLN